MEIKVGRLEAQMEGVDKSLHQVSSVLSSLDTRTRGVEVNLATLTERVAHLPSKGFIITTVLTASSVLAALVVFGDQVKSLLSL